MIVSLGDWVLRTACIAHRALEREGFSGLRMAVNVSVNQFRHPDFIAKIDTILTENDVSGEAIELEITESVAMLDADLMTRLIDELKSRKIMVAIDDFGTGFSSLSYLERLRVDRLKVDRSFVTQMTQGDSGRRIIETIVQLGRNLDLAVIAEGVESESEVETLQAIGCHEGQGYHFARPMELGALLDYLRAH